MRLIRNASLIREYVWLQRSIELAIRRQFSGAEYRPDISLEVHVEGARRRQREISEQLGTRNASCLALCRR